jgi:hypothetical protein
MDCAGAPRAALLTRYRQPCCAYCSERLKEKLDRAMAGTHQRDLMSAVAHEVRSGEMLT